MPGTFPRVWPSSGETCEAPWMSWTNVGGGGGASVANVHVSSPAIVSGGSLVSWSETCEPTTVTVHVSPWAKSASGSSVNAVGPPLTAAVWVPLVPHEIENQEPPTFTGSLKVIVTFAFAAMPVAPPAGERETMLGGWSPRQKWSGEIAFRGAGGPAVKSAPLLSVSVQPESLRRAAVVFESVEAAEAPSKKFAPS